MKQPSQVRSEGRNIKSIVKMYASFCRNSPVALSADVLSLSWKGDARRGWLATGNSKKTVGVTYTEICDEDEFDIDPSQPLEQYFDPEQVWALEKQAMRRNFNFREHTKEVPNTFCTETGEVRVS